MFSGTFETETPFIELSLRMLLALVLGGVIGFERELKHRPAGLRTNMMVSLAAATFTLLAAELVSESTEVAEIIRIDTLRIIDAVIAGVAFLGAGAIIRAGGDVSGLTTGASLWMAGAIGVACGGGYYIVAGTAAFLSIVVLALVSVAERALLKRKSKDWGPIPPGAGGACRDRRRGAAKAGRTRHGRMVIGVPLGTAAQISSIARSVTAMQPSVQSRLRPGYP